MEELFRFIQQAVVIPADGEQIDLTTDSDFQDELRRLIAEESYSEVRAEAQDFLDDIYGGGNGGGDNGADGDNDYSDDYQGSLERVNKYVLLRDRISALLAASAVTDDRVNLAVKDVFGTYASEIVADTQFLTDKKFASDVLVAIKLITRFDLADVVAVTTMRQVIAFIEDLVAGRATAGWHPIQLTPPSTAASDSGVASVSRDPGHMSVFWIGNDESVHTARWAAGSGWYGFTPIQGTGGASKSSGVAAVSRDSSHMNVWWITKDGKVMVAEWTADAWRTPEEIATDASPTSGVAALSRSATHMEVWWIGKNGLLRNAWWVDGQGWKVNQNPLANNASTTSGIAVLSRNATHMEVWWVDKSQLVQGAWWVEGDGWHGPYLVAGQTKASASSGLAAVSRTPTQMDVWWIGDDGSVKDSRWTKADGWTLPPQTVAGRDSASASSGVAALSRNSTHMQVWWIGQERAVKEARWAPDEWHNPKLVAEANSAASTSGVAAVSRTPSHMELWWIGKDRAVQDAWWLDIAPEDSAAEHIRHLLARPLQLPEIFLPPPPVKPETPSPAPDPERQRRDDLTKEHDAFHQAYDTLMSLPPGQLEIKTTDDGGPDPHVAGEPRDIARNREPADGGEEPAAGNDAGSAIISVLGVPESTLAAMNSVVTEHLQAQLGDPSTAAYDDILGAVKRRWLDLSHELEPLRTPAPARIYRLGMNLFAVQEPATTQVPPDEHSVPDFSHAVTRPVGVGDLQVVRQTLIGYEPADISHIENVLPGELMRRTTLREETTELIITEETETTQSEERDTQTTERNELVAETQKEASQQSTTTTDQTSTSNYGRLVENSKTNYARSVTDRAVSKLTQSVRQQRVQREKKVFSDKGMHQLDNSNGQKTIRGIYQWVDKKYQVKVLNYGKRLLYDVVLPEPAAFLIDSLKNAVPPESFQATKPSKPTLQPGDITPTNYMTYAAIYGVTGVVTPPPAELTTVFANSNATSAGTPLDAYGFKYQDGQFFTHFKITVPNDYTAIGGFITRTNPRLIGLPPEDANDTRLLEVYIGEYVFRQLTRNPPLNFSFTLTAGETGDIPVLVRSFKPMMQFNYAVGIKCRRTDAALEQWKLKTHAQIVAGYERQRTNYLDELSRYQAAVRAQMALAGGYARGSVVEREELKKAFVHLLMAEHFTDVYFPTPDPTAFPPDPEYVKKWGAVTAFFERAFEWEHLMYLYYPYFWGRQAKWGELILIQDLDPQFEAFLKAGAARVVVPVRPGFEAALAHYHETGDVWMGEEIPNMFSKLYVSIIAEIKARNAAPGKEECVEEWEVRLPTTLIIARDDNELPKWTPIPCHPDPDD